MLMAYARVSTHDQTLNSWAALQAAGAEEKRKAGDILISFLFVQSATNHVL
jgi:hypothetical protein